MWILVMDIFESALKALKKGIDTRYQGNLVRAAEDFKISYQTLYSWVTGKRRPSLSKLAPILDILGAEITLPNYPRREIKLVKAYIVDASLPPPQEDDYLATPILGEVGAGPGIIPDDELMGWFMVHRSVIKGRGLHNLIAVEIAPRSISMRPTLNPGDLVLVDMDDKEVSRNGNIMLVKDPRDNSGMVKRVSIHEDKSDAKITFYSDNASQFPPMVYSLMEDFDGEWGRAIAGKVIWAWTDMRGK